VKTASEGKQEEMKISYKKIWEYMSLYNYSENELREKADISPLIFGHLKKDEPVRLKYLLSLCELFHCNIGDLVDAVEENTSSLPSVTWKPQRTVKADYQKLWTLMEANKLTKPQLAKGAEISVEELEKMNHNEPVSMDIMLNLCKVFHCSIGDLMDITE
jgi:DNA-binding Xre family transcriptional regulator